MFLINFLTSLTVYTPNLDFNFLWITFLYLAIPFRLLKLSRRLRCSGTEIVILKKVLSSDKTDLLKKNWTQSINFLLSYCVYKFTNYTMKKKVDFRYFRCFRSHKPFFKGKINLHRSNPNRMLKNKKDFKIILSGNNVLSKVVGRICAHDSVFKWYIDHNLPQAIGNKTIFRYL